METRLHIHDHNPATMTAKMIGSVCWLEIKQGDDTISLAMPARMDAAARMIAEAFNAHMHGGPITKLAQTGLPSGGALSAGSLLTDVSVSTGTAQVRPSGQRPSPSDGLSRFHAPLPAWTDLDAARAIERRDLP